MRSQLVASARKQIHGERVRWTLGWAGQRFLSPPLPMDPAFWSLVESLKRDLGSDATAVLSELLDEAAAPYTEQLYVALLAGLKDPATETRLSFLASAPERSLHARGLALYGLGLLETESAWKAALEAFESGSSSGRSIYYAGMGLFGDRAFPILLKEAESAKSQGTGWAALKWVQGPESRDRLWEIVDSTLNDDLRGGALHALTREPDAKAVSRLFDLLDNPDRPSGVRVDVRNRMMNLFAVEGYTMEGDSHLLARVLARWESMAPEIRWALCCDPAVRRVKPNEIDALSPPDNLRFAYLYALASDPAQHGRLASYIGSHLEDLSLLWSFPVLQRQNGFSDLSLAAVARSEALRLPEGGTLGQSSAWSVLSLGPPEVRAEALAEVARRCARLTLETDRLSLLTGLARAGPDAVPVAQDLLRRETSPLVRLELLGTALSIPGKEAEVRALAAGEIDQVLSAVTDSGMRYVAAYPGGGREGLNRYAELVRLIFSAYGTTADIPKIRNYFSTLVLPESLRSGSEALTEVDCRQWLQEGIIESIDAIRARE